MRWSFIRKNKAEVGEEEYEREREEDGEDSI